MKQNSISLFLGLCSMFMILPIGYGIRHHFDREEYDYMIISILVAVFFIIIGKVFINDAFKKEKKEIDKIR